MKMYNDNCNTIVYKDSNQEQKNKIYCMMCNKDIAEEYGKTLTNMQIRNDDTFWCKDCAREALKYETIACQSTLRHNGDTYVVLDDRDKGSLGTLYQLWNETTGLVYAAKAIDKSLSKTKGFQKKLTRYFERADQLDHQNILQLREIWKVDGEIYLISPYMTGCNISDFTDCYLHELLSSEYMELAFWTYFDHIFDGLAYLHNKGLVHGNLKFENVIVQEGLCYKMCDYMLNEDSIIPLSMTKRKKTGNIIIDADEIRYADYSKVATDNAINNRRVFFFYASWCPTCKSADLDLKSNLRDLPADVVVLRVNYNDSETDQEEKDLAKKYGITYQHTFVQIDDQGKEVTKWNGGKTEELIANIK